MAIKKVRGNLCRDTATNLFRACDARKGRKKTTKKRRRKASMGSTKDQICTKTKRVWSPFYGHYVERCDSFKPNSKKSRKKSGKCKKWKKVYSPFFGKKVRRCADFA